MMILLWVLVILLVLEAIGDHNAISRITEWINDHDLKHGGGNKHWDWTNGPDPKWIKDAKEYVSEYKLAVLTGSRFLKHYKKIFAGNKIHEITELDSAELKKLEQFKPDAVILDVLSTNSSEIAFFDLLKASENLKETPIFVLVNNEKELTNFKQNMTGHDKALTKPCLNLVEEVKAVIKH